jgi:hypothetical protein
MGFFMPPYVHIFFFNTSGCHIIQTSANQL